MHCANFKRKHCSPVQPEIRIKHLIIKHILNGFVIQILILREEQLHDLHAAFLAQAEFAVRVCVLASVDRRTTERVVRIVFIQPVIFIETDAPGTSRDGMLRNRSHRHSK